MGIKKLDQFNELPFELDKTYKTKFQSGEYFILKEIIWFKGEVSGFKGIYVDKPHLGICPLGRDRLIPDKIKIDSIDVCDCCGTPIK